MRSIQAQYARPKGIFSQLDEDLFLMQYFQTLEREHGRFLDIGAYDGHFYSNTCVFAMRGWSGVCVEAAKIPFDQLSRLYPPSHKKIKCLHAAVTVDHDGEIDLHETAHPLSTTLESNTKIFANMTEFKLGKVPAVSVPKLIEMFPGPYDLISIDTEGTSVDLLLALPESILTDRGILCVEEDIGVDQIIDSMEAKGFKMVHENGLNVMFVRNVP
jgi:FkbM family methyltransferase